MEKIDPTSPAWFSLVRATKPYHRTFSAASTCFTSYLNTEATGLELDFFYPISVEIW